MPENKPKIVELICTSVSERTKWNRKAGKKLSKNIYVARLLYIDESGKKREKSKEFLKKRDAEDYNRSQRASFERSGGREIEAEKMTFNDLANHYETHYAKAAEYSGDRKVSGLRSLLPVQGYIATLRKHFGGVKLKKVSYGQVRDFRALRLKTPVITKRKVKVPLMEEERKAWGTRRKNRFEWKEETRPRKIASVNRELTTLRRMLNVAQAEGWIAKNPFSSGEPLINMADETHRQRILSVEEERRLLAVCDCDERQHLKAIVICLLDTGMRLSEALTLAWADLNLEGRVIHIKAFNSKTAKPKSVPVSERLYNELVRLQREKAVLQSASIGLQDDRVFGIKSNVNRSWRTARKFAGLEDVRLHDLRHTFGTRLDRSGFTQPQIARLLGHQQTSTTYRYINPDKDLLQDVKSAVESFHSPGNVDEHLEMVN